jgi:hypothetical protein
MGSNGGQKAIVSALASNDAKKAIINILKSEEAKEVFVDNFAEAFHQVVAPILDNHDKRIKKLETSASVVS